MRPEPSVQKIFGEFPYATLVEEIQDFAIFLIDLQGHIVSWNEGAVKLFGYEKSEIVGRFYAQLFVPEDGQKEAPQQEMQAALCERRVESLRWHLKKDGSRFWADGVMSVLQGDAGQPLGFTSVLRDDTARKQVEDDLRRSEERFNLVARATNDAIWDWDLGTDEIWWNPNVSAVLGYAADMKEKVSWWEERIHPDDKARVMNELRATIESQGQLWTCQHRFLRADGSSASVINRGLVLRDAEGAAMRVVGAVHDITERRKLEEQQKIFEQLAENSPDFVAMCDLEFKPLYRNSEAMRVLGQRSPNFVGKPSILDCFFPEDQDFVLNEFFPRVLREGSGTTEIRLRHLQTGAPVWMSYQLFVMRDKEGQPAALATISRDISERKRADSEREELLEKLEFERLRLSQIFQSAPAFVAVVRGPDHTFELANPAYYQLVGHRDIIGKTLLQALPEIAGQGFVELLDQVRETGVPYEGREMVVMLQREPNGPVEERFVDLLYQPLFESDGTVSGVFSHGVDMTEQVRARRAVEDANRVKDEFLATLSHELRTPLTAILGWVSILQSGALSGEEMTRGLETIERNARAQGQLIEDILDVSRVITGKLRLEVRPVELNDIIEEAVATLSPAATAKGIRLQRILDAGASLVSGDPTRLGQIAWNLLSNAIKFTPKGGRVQVRLERVNSHVEMTISDSGLGIASEVLPHVFERFRQADSSSTRAHGGLGLGLAIVRHLVELHGGSVEAHSEGLGHGSEFTVKLPLVALRSLDMREEDEKKRIHPTARLKSGAASSNAPHLQGIHVLLVDDQADTRFLLTVVLERCGARVTAVDSAEAGFQALVEKRPDVLLSDIGMPGEDGYSLIKRVRALSACEGGQTPAAALTAFARVEDRVRVLRSGFQLHLPKPIEPMELATVVANLAGRHEGVGRDEG